jgi:DNA repair photolyase
MMKTVKNHIERKSLLYKTEVEYGDYTINHVLGCSHGCLYPCYAFMMAKRFGKIKSYNVWIEPCLVSNTLDLLEKEIPKLRDKISSVHLCFSTDPFMYEYDESTKMSINAMSLLNDNGIKCTALTKGLFPVKLSQLSENNEYGITLISLNENFRKKTEPHASPYAERIMSLKKLHNKGCKTWVSIEPYPTPNIIEQDISALLNAVEFVDKIIFGRLNYNSDVTRYQNYKSYYNDLSQIVMDFCDSKKIDYHIKEKTITQNSDCCA